MKEERNLNMLDNRYKSAFKEVSEILKYMDEELVNKIPTKFITFLQENMSKEYDFKINENIALEEQNISREAENILALLYRNYWATKEEKQEFARLDEQERKSNDEKLQKIFKNTINEFDKEENKDTQIVNVNNDNFFKKIINKLKKFFRKNNL